MSKKTIVIAIIIILLLCSCITVSGAVGGYFYYKSKSDEEPSSQNSDDDSTTEENDDDSNDSSDDLDVDEDNDDQDTEQDDDETDNTDDLTYTNSYYGFSLTLEPGWEDYDVNEVSGSDYAGFVNYYDFSLPSTVEKDHVTLFTIMVYTDEQWAGILASGALDFTGEEKVGESGGYVFSFSHINGSPPSDLQARMLDLDTIKDSFELD